MILNINNLNTIKEIRNPVVICGSGPAGMALALTLERKSIPSIIIESGYKEYNEKAQSRYDGAVFGNFPDNMMYSRLSQFGGTSGHWGGTSRPLDSYDYEFWPINKSELDKYLDDSCSFLGIRNLFGEFDINENLKLIEFQQSRLRISEKYFDYVKKSNKIHLLLESSIYDLEIDDGIVKSILIKHLSNITKKIDTGTLVLACGGIENSRLLKWFNRIQNNSYFQNDNIGRYFMEHPFKIIGKGFGDFGKINKKFANNYYKFENYRNWGINTYSIALKKDFIKKKKILNSSIQITLHERNNDSVKNFTKNFLCLSPKISEKLVDKFDRELLCGFTLSSSWEQDPEHNNKILLSKTDKDFFSIPYPEIHYSVSQKTLNTAIESAKEIGNFFAKNELGRVALANDLNIDKFISEAGYHHMGGTKMGTNNRNGVVDKNLKIFGIKNMYVAGSSVFPTGGHANPTLTIVQLSKRLAKNISSFYKI